MKRKKGRIEIKRNEFKFVCSIRTTKKEAVNKYGKGEKLWEDGMDRLINFGAVRNLLINRETDELSFDLYNDGILGSM